MRRFILLGIIVAVLVLPIATIQAAPPPDGPPGQERAKEVKERHEDALLRVSGVVGAAVRPRKRVRVSKRSRRVPLGHVLRMVLATSMP